MSWKERQPKAVSYTVYKIKTYISTKLSKLNVRLIANAERGYPHVSRKPFFREDKKIVFHNK